MNSNWESYLMFGNCPFTTETNRGLIYIVNNSARVLVMLIVSLLCMCVIDPIEAIALPIIQQESDEASQYQLMFNMNNMEMNYNHLKSQKEMITYPLRKAVLTKSIRIQWWDGERHRV